MTTTLIIRLSSLGDLAIAIPVVCSVAKKHPDDRFVLLTHSAWQSLFVEKPSNLVVFPFDKKGKHSGLVGLLRLIRELNREICTEKVKVADLHGVLRSFVIDLYFKCRGLPVKIIDKGRKEKRALTRQKNKRLKPLKTSLSRYQEVFEKLGYNSQICLTKMFNKFVKKEVLQIGIAPFAGHRGKMYPLGLMEQVVSQLNSLPCTNISLFGSREEGRLLESWEEKYANLTLVAGKMTFREELNLMSQMDVMVSMDSANMNLASLVDTPVVSIWGATHPYAGFYGFNQNESNIIQLDMPCRPCSIFGNKPCYRGDYACLNRITPESVFQAIRHNICT